MSEQIIGIAATGFQIPQGVTAEGVFHSAVQFEVGGEVLCQYMTKRMEAVQGSMQRPHESPPAYLSEPYYTVVYPAVTNWFFGAEMYLKCFLLIESKKPWGHDLWRLFEGIGRKNQLEIRKAFKQQCEQSKNAATLKKLGFKRVVNLTQRASPTMKGTPNYRYAFEGIPDGAVYPSLLCRTLRQAILRVRPEWVTRFQNLQHLPACHSH